MDEIAKAYTLLSSIKANVPTNFEVDQSWVDDYHAALEQVENATGLSLREYRVSHADMHRETTGGNYLTGEVFYSGRTVVERSRFMMKVDAVLGYFTLKTEPKKQQIGFSKK